MTVEEIVTKLVNNPQLLEYMVLLDACRELEGLNEESMM